MTTHQEQRLLKTTDKVIEKYCAFMAGQGNFDTFEHQLYNADAKSYHEDSLVFCNKLLTILGRRKLKLQHFLKEGNADE